MTKNKTKTNKDDSSQKNASLNNDKQSFEDDVFNFTLKSAAGVALSLLVIIAYFASGVVVSEFKSIKLSRDPLNNEVAYDLNDRSRDPETIKRKQGLFRSIFCSGNQRSAICN